jgi:HSP20 family protein
MLRSPLFNELLNMRSMVDQAFRENPFGDAFGTLWSRAEDRGGPVAHPMPIDVYATDAEIVIVAAVPGMRPEDLDLSIQRNTVTLSGTVCNVAESEDTKDATWYVHELTSGTYRRSLTLPVPVDADKAEATFEQGILRVVLPKSEASRPRKIEIHAGSSQDQAIEANITS